MGFEMWKGSVISAVEECGDLSCQGHQCLVMDVGLVLQSGSATLCASVIPASGRCHSSAHRVGAGLREPPARR